MKDGERNATVAPPVFRLPFAERKTVKGKQRDAPFTGSETEDEKRFARAFFVHRFTVNERKTIGRMGTRTLTVVGPNISKT
jgi:hypothetical protein